MRVDNAPGAWAYYHPECGKLALAFSDKVVERPNGTMWLDDLDIAQQGQHRSERRTRIICQHCGLPVPTNDGKIIDSLVVHIDTWIERKNAASSKIRYRRSRRELVTRENMGVALIEGQDPPPAEGPPLPEDTDHAPSPQAQARFDEAHPVIEGGVSYAEIKAELAGKEQLGDTDNPNRPDKKVPGSKEIANQQINRELDSNPDLADNLLPD